MEIEKRVTTELSVRESGILMKLLHNIEDIIATDEGTLIKFKGNLITITDGTQIFKSDKGNIVHLANTIHLNPLINTFESVKILDEQLKEIQVKNITLMNELGKIIKGD